MSKKQKYDGWTRKLIKKLRKIGFVMTKPNATSHRKYTLKDNFSKEITLIIPTHIPEYSRAAVIDYVRRTLEEGGADKKTLQAFRQYALGMLDAERDDDIDELEDKLFVALKMGNIINAVSIAFIIGQRTELNDDKLQPDALQKFTAEKEEQISRNRLAIQVEKSLFEFFKVAVSEQLSRTPVIFVNSRAPFLIPFFDIETCNKHGFEIISVVKDEDGGFLFSGLLRTARFGDLFDGKSEIAFSSRIGAEEDQEDLYITSADVFEDIHIEYCYWMAENKYDHFEKQFMWLSLKHGKK